MSQFRYTDQHEWAIIADNIVTVGITNFAQDQLGDLVFVELPSVGTDVVKGDEAAVIESVKAAGDVKSPVTGKVIEINQSLVTTPEKVNADPMGEGWFYKVLVENPAELQELMDEDSYKTLVATLS